MSQSSKILQQSAAAFKMSAAAKMGRVWWISLALLTIGSLLLLVSQNARATALANPLGDFASAQSQQHLGDYNNLGKCWSERLWHITYIKKPFLSICRGVSGGSARKSASLVQISSPVRAAALNFLGLRGRAGHKQFARFY